AVVASYFPLNALPGAEKLLDRAWSAAMTDVLVQQVREPAQERQLRGAIPALTAIEDEVSRQVRDQYEQNPYPRWTKAEPARAAAAISNTARPTFSSSVRSAGASTSSNPRACCTISPIRSPAGACCSRCCDPAASWRSASTARSRARRSSRRAPSSPSGAIDR